MAGSSEAVASIPIWKKTLANKLLLNGLLFQAGWFACVLGGDVVALLSLLAFFYVHARFFVTTRLEWVLIGAAIIVGVLVDNLLSWQGIFNFQRDTDQLTLLFIPAWLCCLWAMFATTLMHSLVWLRNRLLMASAFGAAFAPLSYIAGGKLADVELMQPLALSWAVIAVCWAIVMPLFFSLANRLSHHRLSNE